MTTDKHAGSSLDDFLKDEGVYDEFKAKVTKERIVWQLEQAMKAQHISKRRMAELMETGRAQIDRLLNPDDGNITLETLHRAAQIVGRSVQFDLVEPSPASPVGANPQPSL